MVCKQQLSSKILEFWSRTRKAWANGEMLLRDQEVEKIAKNDEIPIDYIIDESPLVVAAIRFLKPNPDEFLYAYSPKDCDILLTNQRLMVRNHRTEQHEIYSLADIASCSESGWWRRSLTLTLQNGLIRHYGKLHGTVKAGFIQQAIAMYRRGLAEVRQHQVPDQMQQAQPTS